MSRLISFVALIAIIIVIGLLFYNVMAGFFVPVFLAAVLVVVFHPLHRWVLEKTGQREKLAATLTTLLIMICVLLPLGTVITAASVQGLRLLKEVLPPAEDGAQSNTTSVRLRIGLNLDRMRDFFGLHMDHEEFLRNAQRDLDRILREADQAPTSDPTPEIKRLGKAAAQTFAEFKAEVQLSKGEAYVKGFDELIEIANFIALPSEGEPSFQELAIRLSEKYGVLKTELLGGTYMAFAKEVANPTPKQIRESTQQIVDFLQPRLVSITGATGAFFLRTIVGGVVLLVSTFFFLLDGPSMVKNIMHLSPLDDRYEEELLLEFDRISRAVVLATLLSALVQGLTAGIGYYFAGMDSLPLLIMLTCTFALVPFVGPAVVWVPVCFYIAFIENRPTTAIALACWGVLVVGTIDNFVKAFVLHGQSQLHPLLALLSVLGGVQTLGPVGIVVGPMVVALLQTLLSILQRELLHFEQQRTPEPSVELKSTESLADDLASVVKEVVAAAGPSPASGIGGQSESESAKSK